MRSKQLVVAGIFVLGLVGSIFAQPYYYGAIREEQLPDWILESPAIEAQAGNELDESVFNYEGLPPVGNQSSQGSCTAWATAYYYLTYLQWQEHGFDTSDPDNICSPAFTYNLINGGTDSGSMPSDAFEIFEKIGCGTMSDIPYTASNCTNFPEEETFINGMVNRIDQTYSISTQSQAGLQTLKNHLLNGNIAMTAITVWSNFNEISSFNYTYCVNDIYGSDPGGHAVTIVGFDDNFETSDGTGAFRMVNSWGPSWGDDGFWWMSYEAFMNDIIGWGYALYASDRIDYEPQLYAAAEIQHSDRYNLRYRVGVGDVDNPAIEALYFDIGMRGRSQIAFPEGSRLILDATDLYPYLDANSPNEVFLSIQDRGYNNGHSGNLLNLQVEDMALDFRAISGYTPMTIPDYNAWVTTPLTLYYRVVPPEGFAAAVDLSNGNVNLTWDTANELNEFNEYMVYRDGEEIGRTSSTQYVDELSEFGIYSYEIVSAWDEAVSWPSATVEINYIEPVEPRFTNIAYVSDAGAFTLNWDQLRGESLQYDNGVADASFCPSNEASRGAMVAQQFTAPDNGKVTSVGAYFRAEEDIPNGNIRVYMMRDDNGTPGEKIYWGDIHTPSSEEGWRWYDAQNVRVALDAGEQFWLAVAWYDLNCTRLGRDMSSNANGTQKVSPDGEHWVTTNVGHPMLRVEYGSEELVDDWTGLLGYDVYMNDALVAEVDNDTKTFQGNFENAGVYNFRIVANYLQGDWQGETWQYEWNGTEQDVDDSGLPLAWEFQGAYPNPFNPTTTIGFTLKQATTVQLRVFNLLGQEVAQLANRTMRAGQHQVLFDGHGLASGLYVIRFDAGPLHETRKIVLMK